VKKIIILVVLIALFPGAFLFAQATTPVNNSESEFYYFNFSIEKVYTHRMGYMVLYRRNDANTVLSRTFLPTEWFSAMGGRGELVMLGSGREWPSMTVYYRNGEFSHVRLRLRRERMHSTWGVIPLNVNMDEYFRGIEEVKLYF
jgi:hypothetical protein